MPGVAMLVCIRRFARLLWVPALLISAAQSSPVMAADAAVAMTPAERCAALRKIDFSNVPDAPAAITSSVVVRTLPDLPEVCELEGYVYSTIGFKISLPLDNWNGKTLQSGCGGACGTTKQFWCDEPLRRGYACVSSDMGHKSTLADWMWGRDNTQARADFGFRSTHAAAIAARAIAAAYYASAPKHAFYMGCSTGGRQAFVEAERFPYDFDGIIAGAPPLNEIGTGLGLAWSVRANHDAKGNYILLQHDAELINDAVVAACDMNDGIKDGVIGDPRLCTFDVASLRCGSGKSKACLSDAKIEAAKKIYSGPVDAKGHKIGRVGGPMLGSERNWIGDYVPRDGQTPQYVTFIESFFRYMAFSPSPGSDWTLKDLDFDRDSKRFDDAEALYNAENPDLRRYRDSGGKLLFFQGWSDTSVAPSGSVDYYETATRVLGGAKAAGDFFRFFTVPGMRHCSSDGNGADAIDYLTVIEKWVEAGQAPDKLVGVNYNQKGLPLRSLVFPLDPTRVGITRPQFPYPAHYEYIGSGDPNDVANYRAVVPSAATSAAAAAASH